MKIKSGKRGRPRTSQGHVQLETRGKIPTWVFHWHPYVGGKRTHQQATLGTILEITTPEAAEASAERFRQRNGLKPCLDYLRCRTAEEKARCSDQQYRDLVLAQQGRCAICNGTQTRLCLDHCHVTGMVRALLCSKCNAGIGLLGDNSALVRAAAEYLTEHETRIASISAQLTGRV